MLDYVSGHRRLAVQWTSWLTHTRPNPPTLEELQADFERQRRILQNVARIEARDRAEAAQIAAEQAPTAHLQVPTQRSPEPSTTGPKEPTNPVPRVSQDILADKALPQAQADSRLAETHSPWKPPPPDEPHSWQPQASIRRGG
ncbi:hypothetical protein BD309DRAFT_959565 [Dichomitus squalens]|uniref:Uncharacterized protein n=1 Tax=Dichomitus squalens TaxID=114155 RepID=A0A4Q9Q0C9_9APHY|nr:hypothetical protein BD309DRAFT_959565 [Dichomitus squalens]TBU60455.1 hypothetical protein BD310DRAFT_922998 [Dichomitus squalens]